MAFDDLHEPAGERFDCVRQERERLDLRAHEINKKFFVEIFHDAEFPARLERDGVENRRQERDDVLVDVLFVQLVHQDEDDRQFLQHFEGVSAAGKNLVGHRVNVVDVHVVGVQPNVARVENFVHIVGEVAVDVLDVQQKVFDLKYFNFLHLNHFLVEKFLPEGKKPVDTVCADR